MIEEHYVPGRRGKIGYQYRVNTGLCKPRMDGEEYERRVAEMAQWCHDNTIQPGEVVSGNYEVWNMRLMRVKTAPALSIRTPLYHRSSHYMFFLFNNHALATMFMLRYKPIQP
ncbi:MAG: hypothetical protein EOP83_01685 [Verrucomicrobiaceae bacterium]|nr:MAG: hypothetical protein EOP83_01685 [Verrucomicrobiaceae bacterium]